jgi:hypothetical protein
MYNIGRPAAFGQTMRKDIWWLEPLLVALGFGAFIVYSTYRACENQFFEVGPYLSPFYSPKFTFDWWHFSPAFLILWIPAGFRATCYYYRKAYYRAYFADPVACSVGQFANKKYCGESAFPLVLQNCHRYFFYLATIVLAVLWYDALKAFFYDGAIQVSLLGLVMLANVLLLSGYSFGCHACRHLAGGKLNCFSANSCTQSKFKIWNFITKLNEHHMAWAWFSLFSVGFTDFYIRQVACGAISDFKFF